MQSLEYFLNMYFKIFVLLTPFFVITVFLALTKEYDEHKKRSTAVKVAFAVIVIAFVLYYFGVHMFSLFGITIDSFRIGAGVLLFLSALSLVQGNASGAGGDGKGDIAVVPLAIPVTAGPATVGTLLIMGAETTDARARMLTSVAIIAAIGTVGILLYVAGWVEKCLGQTKLTILSKLTGLILSSIAAQMIFTGIKNMLR